jgi:hypothetical protein
VAGIFIRKWLRTNIDSPCSSFLHKSIHQVGISLAYFSGSLKEKGRKEGRKGGVEGEKRKEERQTGMQVYFDLSY